MEWIWDRVFHVTVSGEMRLKGKVANRLEAAEEEGGAEDDRVDRQVL